MAFQFEALNNRQVSQREHREILAACRAGDLELAAARLKAHITTAGRQLKDALYGAGLG
jgi:DNA-binding GntR family transcriptional regulator